MLRLSLFCVFLAIVSVQSAKILFVSTTPSYGSQVVLQPIWKELSLRGHKVTAITPNPIKDSKLTNLTEISVKFVYEMLDMKYDYTSQVARFKDEPLRYSTFFLSVLLGINQDILMHPDVELLIRNPKAEFDLVIVEFMVPTMLAFGHRFQCPTIAVTSVDASIMGHDAIGNPNHPALQPDNNLKFNVQLSFMQRVFSTINLLIRKAVFKVVKQVEDETVAKHFGPNYPSLEELVDSIQLFLMNVNPAFHNARPTVPAVVHFGGQMSIRPPEELPKDVKSFLDKSTDGAVYFSLGTVVKAKMLTPEFLQIIFTAFSQMPFNFLIHLDIDENIPEKPDNFMIKKWVPQQDILRHPNVKVFINQCGLQSIEEAIYYNVPIIGLPFFGDQFSNCIQAYRRGLGIIFDINQLNVKHLQTAIVEVIKNPVYEERAFELAKIAQDQPMTGLDKAVWWIEHVIRNKGAKHLRTPSLDIPFWQFYLLDVISFLLVMFALIATIFYVVFRKCLSICGKGTIKAENTKAKTQ